MKLSGISLKNVENNTNEQKNVNEEKDLKTIRRCLIKLKNENAAAAAAPTTMLIKIKNENAVATAPTTMSPLKTTSKSDKNNDFQIDSKFAKKILNELKKVIFKMGIKSNICGYSNIRGGGDIFFLVIFLFKN